MDRKALKQALRYAKDGAVHVAFAQGPDGKAVVQLHRRKMGRALEMELRGASPEARNFRWGTLEVDPGEPKQALVKVNKSVSGMSRRLVLAFKGTGISKVRLLPQDGGEAEAYEEEDEEAQEEEAQEDGAAPSQAGETEDAGPGAGAGGSQAVGTRAPREGSAEAQAVKAQLMELVGRMLEAIRREPSQKAALSELATDAQASLKRGDVEQAAAGAEVLRMALDAAERAGASDGEGPEGNGTTNGQANGRAAGEGPGKRGAEPGEAPDAPDDGALQAFAASARAWSAARAQVDGQLRKLQAAVVAASEGEFGEELAADFLTAVEPVLSTLDDTLSKIFAAASKAKDPSQGAALKKHARATLVRYAKFVQSDPTIKHLDANPFVQLQIGKTLSTTLGRLSSQVK